MWPFLHPESMSQNSRSEWDAVSACGSVGKLHPTPIANSGSHFPPSPSTGNCIPFQALIPGHIFREPDHPESPSHSDYIQRTHASVLSRTTSSRGDGKCHPERLPRSGPPVKKKASRISRLSHLYCFARRTANGEATRPARPSWPPPPYGPDHPWWDDPLRQPSCRAAT